MLVLLLLFADEPASQPADFTTVVTATRAPRPVHDAPADTYVIPRAEIDRSPTLTSDELLRTDPEVQTFRQSSSLVADPTSQGLSLRGIGPSGVSRAVLLFDGVPVNDGYGGWVYWRALPRLSIDHVEVVPGGGSAQYGTSALGGVVQMFSRASEGRAFDADAQIGSQGTMLGAARAAGRNGVLAGAIEVEGLHSDGYVVTSPAERGPIDAPAPTTHGTVNAQGEAQVTHAVKLSLAGGYFDETQNSGTPLSGSHVRFGHAVLGADIEAFGEWHARLFGRAEEFDQTRSRVAAGRTSEALTATQAVPSDDLGGSLAWNSRPLGAHVIAAGIDMRAIDANASEHDTNGLTRTVTGSHQQLGGVFAQESWRPLAALEILGALRADFWHNAGGTRTTNGVDAHLADASAAHLSPKLAARYSPLSWLTLRGSLYDSFRAPTLNELYRPFQVGTILTAANDKLAPETLFGGELGVHVALPHVALHATGFANKLSSPILNVTLAAPLADGSTRQRENIGGARILGLDAGADWRIAPHFLLSLAYVFVDTRVTSAPLLGKRLAQDPAHRLTAAFSFTHAWLFDATAAVRFVSSQYEDDLNTLPIAPYVVVDLSLARHVVGPLSLFVAVQNLLNTTYVVGRAGIDTVGEPFEIRGGVRVRAP